MNLRWSLDELYPSFECEEFKNDFKRFGEFTDEMKAWARKNFKNTEKPTSKIEHFIKMQNQISELYTRLSGYSGLTLSVDAKNETAREYDEKLDLKLTELTEPEVKFEKWLSSVRDLDKLISRSDILKEHSFYLHEIVEKSRYLLDEKEEAVISMMKNTGSNAWARLQQTLTSTLLVDINIDGEEKHLPLPVVRNMAYDKDPVLRKKAYEAELSAYKKIEESSAACLNGIKGEVLIISKMRGYSSPLEKTLIDSRLDMKILDAMLTAIRESLPSFRKYYRKKAELLGYKNGLPFYELLAPVGDSDMKFTYDDARDFIVRNFASFSKRLSEFADNAFEKRWIDAEPREGKRGGAFCSNLHVIKESRILTNFTGSFSNVTTIAHELGHGYHGSRLVDQTYINSEYPMPIAETASIFCETIIKNAALKNASSEEAFTMLESDIADSSQVIVDILSRFLFESEVFRMRAESPLSVNKFKELMVWAQKEAYGDGLDPDFLHPYMWVNKPHYYYADRNFYNFPYAFGLLFAKGLYAEYLKRGKAFVDDYDKLLSSTGKMKIADITMLMGIDIHSTDFWRSSLKLIENDIEKFVSLK